MDKTLLIEKVIAGNASPDEQQEFDAWIAESEKNRQEFHDVKWLTENSDHAEHDPEDAFYDGLKKIQDKMKTIQQRRRIVGFLKCIALVIIILTVLYFLFHRLGFWTSSNRDWSADLYNLSHTLADRIPSNAPLNQI